MSEEPIRLNTFREVKWTGPMRASVFNYSEETRERNAAYLRGAVKTGFPLRDDRGRVPRMTINVSVHGMMEEVRDRIDRVLMEGLREPIDSEAANITTGREARGMWIE